MVGFIYNYQSSNSTICRCFFHDIISTMRVLNKEVQTMEESLGQRIARLRKNKGLTQEELGDKVGVSSQAVSKWETDSSVPDVMLLVKIANLFDISVDELLGNDRIKETPQIVPVSERRPIDKMILKIIIDSDEGDKVRVNLPISLIRIMIEGGAKMPEINGKEVLKNVNWENIFSLIEQGAIGKLVEIEGSDGVKVDIVVE